MKGTVVKKQPLLFFERRMSNSTCCEATYIPNIRFIA